MSLEEKSTLDLNSTDERLREIRVSIDQMSADEIGVISEELQRTYQDLLAFHAERIADATNGDGNISFAQAGIIGQASASMGHIETLEQRIAAKTQRRAA